MKKFLTYNVPDITYTILRNVVVNLYYLAQHQVSNTYRYRLSTLISRDKGERRRLHRAVITNAVVSILKELGFEFERTDGGRKKSRYMIVFRKDRDMERIEKLYSELK